MFVYIQYLRSAEFKFSQVCYFVHMLRYTEVRRLVFDNLPKVPIILMIIGSFINGNMDPARGLSKNKLTTSSQKCFRKGNIQFNSINVFNIPKRVIQTTAYSKK